MKITFFGASVTEQDTNHSTGEVTGFVTYFEKYLADDLFIEVSRVSSGSSDISNAGLVYVEKVVDINPAICILDWCTPVFDDCNIKYVQHVYIRLLKKGILPLTVVLPRMDREQFSSEIVLKTKRVCEKYGIPFFDYSKTMSKTLCDSLLRDVVHTNFNGARYYAELIRKSLIDVLNVSYLPPKIKDNPVFFTSKIKSNVSDKPACRFIDLVSNNSDNSDNSDNSNECKFFLDQRVGPYTPNLELKINYSDNYFEKDSVEIWDEWCYRERFCIKPLTNWVNPNFKKINISTSNVNPNKKLNSSVEFVGHLKPRGDIYIVTTTPLNIIGTLK